MCTTASKITVQKDLTYKPYNVCFDTGLHADAVLLFASCAFKIHTIQCCYLSCMKRYMHVYKKRASH